MYKIKKVLIKLVSGFIWNREKRHEFKNKTFNRWFSKKINKIEIYWERIKYSCIINLEENVLYDCMLKLEPENCLS